MYKLQKSITNQGIRELSTRSVKVSESPSPKAQVGNTSGVGLSSLPEDHKMIIDEIVWNEMFGESSDESFKGLKDVCWEQLEF